MDERRNAAASGAVGVGLPTLMWALDRSGVEIPSLVITLALFVSVILIGFAIAAWLHLFFQRIRKKRDVGDEVVWPLIGIGVACSIISAASGAFFWQLLTVHPSADMSLQYINERNISDPVKFDYYFINSGSTAAIAFMHNENAWTPDKEVEDNDLDRDFAALKVSLKIPAWEKSTNEIQPGEPLYFTFSYAVPKEQYQLVIAGPKYLYMVALLKYRDKYLAKGKWWYQELCLFTWKGQALHNCRNSGRRYSE